MALDKELDLEVDNYEYDYEQELVHNERKGFVVVEWGGREI